jgi:hypothetical protein
VKLIFVAGPFRGPNAWAVAQNVRKAEAVAFAVAELGAMPMCPHTNTAHFDGTMTDQFWIDGTREMMRRCDAVVLVEGWENSSGTLGEKAEAERRGLPVFEHLAALESWVEHGNE